MEKVKKAAYPYFGQQISIGGKETPPVKKNIIPEVPQSRPSYDMLEEAVRGLRTAAAKRFKKVENATAIIWKLLRVAEKNFRALKGYRLLDDVYAGRECTDKVMVKASKGLRGWPPEMLLHTS